MKRYISAILIPCLLLQLCSCYSFQNITIEELSNQKERDDIIFVDTNNYEYLFKAKNYTISNDFIEGKAMRNKINNEAEKEVFKGKIAISDIKSIQEDQVNYVTTSLLVVFIGIIIAAVTLAKIGMSGWGWE
jgi:hypothetical protein